MRYAGDTNCSHRTNLSVGPSQFLNLAGLQSWLKATPYPPFLEHLSFRLGNQNFYIRVTDGSGDIDGPHYLRNRPVLNANEAGSAVRVMSINTAKGDEAENSALVVISAIDRSMISDDPKLEYVALTRAKINSYPRVTN